MKKINQLLFCALTFSLPSIAIGGSVDGPLVILVDLSKNKELKAIFESQQHTKTMGCMEPRTELFFERRPSGMNDGLLIDGVVKKNKAAMRKLNKLLRMPDDNVDNGYDGIVVYTKNPKPKFITFVSGVSDTLETIIPNSASNASIISLLCEALPPITRKP